MYEDLVKLLREMEVIIEHCSEQSCSECENKELCDKYDNKTLSGIFKETADAIEELIKQHEQQRQNLIALMNEKPRWIPVMERLPEANQEVLCACRAGIFEVLKYVNGINGPWYKDSRHVYMSGFVTHWMPLPEPPKKNGKSET